MSKRLFKTLVALLAIAAAAAGPVRGQNASPDVTLDFTTNDWGIPSGKANKAYDAHPYTSGDYTITLQGGGSSNGYYFNSGYLMLGKSGAYLELPEFSSPVEKIEVVGNSAASPQVNQNIYVGETAVSTQTTGGTGTNTYVINENYQAAGNIYTLKVDNSYNTQITYIKVYYVSSGGGSGSEPPTPGQNSNVSWVLTPYGDLQTGDTVVIVDKTSERALPNNGGTSSTSSAVEIGLSGDQNALTAAPAATLKWVVVLNNGNYQFRKPGTDDQFLYCINTFAGVRVGDNDANQFTFENGGPGIGGPSDVPFLKNTGISRYLGVYNNQEWRCYLSISSDIENTVIGFYVRTGAAPAVPHTVRFASGNDGWMVTDVDSARSATAPAVLQNVMAGDSLVVTAPATLPGKVKSVKAVKYVAPPTPLDNTTTAWSAGTFAVPAGGLTYSDAITVSGDVTLVLTEGTTLTLNKGIILADGATLTIQGNGTMNVNGTNESTASTVAGTGTITLTSGTLTARGGNGGGFGYGAYESPGGNGGNAINGSVIVSGGTLTARGGNGGSVGDMGYDAHGGNGGVAISGTLTINGGSTSVNNGSNGSIGEDCDYCSAGTGGKAVAGTVTDNR